MHWFLGPYLDDKIREVQVHNQSVSVRLEVWGEERARSGAPHDGAIIVYRLRGTSVATGVPD
jgi:hypothetical protein